MTLDPRPRQLRDEPRTGGNQPANISRINRRYVVPSAPAKKNAKITTEKLYPEGVDKGQYISVSLALIVSPTCHLRVRHLPFAVYCSLRGGEESSR